MNSNMNMRRGFDVKPPLTFLVEGYQGRGCIAGGLRKNCAFSDLCDEGDPPADAGSTYGVRAPGGMPLHFHFGKLWFYAFLACSRG